MNPLTPLWWIQGLVMKASEVAQLRDDLVRSEALLDKVYRQLVLQDDLLEAKADQIAEVESHVEMFKTMLADAERRVKALDQLLQSAMLPSGFDELTPGD